MRRHGIGSVVAAFGVALSGSITPAQAADVTSGEGIIVVDLSAAETNAVFEAVDSAAAFAALVSPALPPEYRAGAKLAAGGWVALRLVIPDGIPLRLVMTLVPPAVFLVPHAGSTAEDVIRAYRRIQDQTLGRARQTLKDFAGATAETLNTAQRDLAARWSSAVLSAAVWERGSVEYLQRRVGSLNGGWGTKLQSPSRGRVEAVREVRSETERFAVMAHPDGSISLRAGTGFLSAEGGGGGTAVSNRAEPRAWEHWTVVKDASGTIGLRSIGGQFLGVAEGVVGATQSGWDAVGTKFQFEFSDGAVYIKTVAGKYLTARP